MHLRSWLYSTLLFSVPTTAFYPFNIVDALPAPVEQYALKDITRYDNSQDGKSPAAREKHGGVPTLKMTRRALPVSYQKSATARIDLMCGLSRMYNLLFGVCWRGRHEIADGSLLFRVPMVDCLHCMELK